VNAPLEEPVIPPRLKRPLAAAWISLGLHGALIALVQVAPPASLSFGEPSIEARLVSTHVAPVAPETAETEKAPELAPSEIEDAVPVRMPESEPVVREAPQAEAAPAPGTEAGDAKAAAPATDSAAWITSPVDLTYYGVQDLDVPPRALGEIVPAYPPEADRQRISGMVRLQLKIEADGRVSDIEIVSAAPPDVFDESALGAFRSARFAPAQINGRPVRSLVQIVVRYDREGQPR
jgi:protein TonB